MNEDDVRKAFAQRLLIAINEKGYKANNQKALGELFDTAGQSVRRWLNAQSLPKSTRMPSIAKILGVRIAWLRDGEEPMRDVVITSNVLQIKDGQADYSPSISKEEYNLIINYRYLSKDAREALSLFLDSLR